MITVTFDVLSRTLAIEYDEPMPFGDDLSAALNRHGNVVPLRGVSFGFRLTINGETSDEQSWPPPGVRYSKTDQDTLAAYRLSWQPEDSVQVDAWLVDSQGQGHTATAAFIAPLPPEPDPNAPQPDLPVIAP